MKNLFFVLSVAALFFAMPHTILGQTATQTVDQGVVVKGVVIDAAGKNRLPAASILITAGDEFSKGTSSGSKGEFTFDNVPRGEFTIKISYLGYTPYELKMRADGAQIDFGEIPLKQTDYEIDEVEITATIQMMTTRGDTVVYNPAAFQSIAGDYAVDLIVKFPGIEIDENGSLLAHGETVQWALVDGRLMFGKDVMSTLENVRADDLDEVKIYDIVDPEKPEVAAMPDQEDKQRVIDFTTKSKFTGVMNIQALGGLGKDLNTESEETPWGRYKGEATFGLFNEKRQLRISALTNNTKDDNTETMRRFVAAGRGSGYSGGGDGYGRRNNVTITLSNYNPFRNRDAWQGSVGYTYRNAYDYSNSITERIFLAQEDYNLDTTTNRSWSDIHTLNGTLRKRWGNTSVNLNPTFTYNETRSDNFKYQLQERENGRGWSNINNTTNNGHGFSTSGSFSFNTYFNREAEAEVEPMRRINVGRGPEGEMSFSDFTQDAIPATRRPVSLRASGNWNYSTSESQGLRVIENTENDRTRVLETETDEPSRNFGFSAGVGNVYITPAIILDAGYSLNYVYNQTWRLQVDTLSGIVATGASRVFTRNNTTQRITPRLRIGKSDSKVTVNVGLSYATVWNNRDEEFPRRVSDNRIFHSFTPSFSIGNESSQSSITKMYQWNMRYSTSTNLPSLEQLREYIDTRNALNPVLGNPDLNQSYTHSLTASFRINNTDKAINANFSVTGQYTNDDIANQRVLVTDEMAAYFNDRYGLSGDDTVRVGSRLVTYHNLDGASSLTFAASLSRPFIGNKFVLEAGARYSLTHSPLYEDALLVWNNSHVPSFNVGLRSNHSPYIEYGLTSRTTLNYTLTTGANPFNTVRQNLSAYARVRFLNNFTVNADYTYSYFRRTSDNKVATEPDVTHLLNGAFTWEFAKRAGSLTATVYDILNRNSSFSSSMNGVSMVNSWRQLMGRYGMITLSFRINRTYGGQGGGQNRNVEREGPGGDRGPVIRPGGPGAPGASGGGGRTGGLGGGQRVGGMR